MPYFQLRITFDPSGNRNCKSCYLLCKALIRKFEAIEYSFGMEQLNKYGEPCDQHLHFNFSHQNYELKDPKRAVVNFCRNYASSSDFTLKGNKVWSLQIVDEPKDFKRWLMYPLKECGDNRLFKSQDYQYEELETLSRQLRSESITANILHREKVRDKTTFYNKLETYLDNQFNSNFPGWETIWNNIFEYYQQENKPICFRTIDGYTVLYLANRGRTTPSSAREYGSQLTNYIIQ